MDNYVKTKDIKKAITEMAKILVNENYKGCKSYKELSDKFSPVVENANECYNTILNYTFFLRKNI